MYFRSCFFFRNLHNINVLLLLNVLTCFMVCEVLSVCVKMWFDVICTFPTQEVRIHSVKCLTINLTVNDVSADFLFKTSSVNLKNRSTYAQKYIKKIWHLIKKLTIL